MSEHLFFRMSVVACILFFCSDAVKAESSPPDPLELLRSMSTSAVAGEFLVTTVENRSLESVLVSSMQTVSNSIGKVALGSSTLLALEEQEESGSHVSLGTLYRLDGTQTCDPLGLGSVSVRYGQSAITFRLKTHLWAGPFMRSEWTSDQTHVAGGLQLVRDVYVDAEGRSFVSVRLSAGTARARALLNSGELKIVYQPENVEHTPWRRWLRLPDSSIRRLTFASKIFEGPWVVTDEKRPRELLVAARYSAEKVTSGTDSRIDEELEKRIVTLRPILLQSSMKRWIKQTFPAWDCPEPWLNALWSAAVFSMYSQVRFDDQENRFHLRDDETSWDLRWFLDLRWLRDRRIGSETLLSALQKDRESPWATSALHAFFWSQPELELQKIISEKSVSSRPVVADYREAIRSYDQFVRWCRSLYIDDDFNRPAGVWLSDDGRRLHTRQPVGLIDMVVTRLVGLRVDGSARLTLEPAEWIRHWPYFAIDNLYCRGHYVTVVWQSPQAARRYQNIEPGLSIFVNGRLAGRSEQLGFVEIELKK